MGRGERGSSKRLLSGYLGSIVGGKMSDGVGKCIPISTFPKEEGA